MGMRGHLQTAERNRNQLCLKQPMPETGAQELTLQVTSQEVPSHQVGFRAKEDISSLLPCVLKRAWSQQYPQ